MSEDDLWVIVEGRDHDRPHYERLLHALPSTKNLSFSIRLAEETEVNGKSAGGKDHALALHDHLQSSNSLVQRNKAGKSHVVFLLDRDRDDFLGKARISNHVFYTHGSDVEADILLNADLWAAIRSAYGVDTRLTTKLRRAIPDPALRLVALWDEWLVLGLTALACDSPGSAPWSQLSKVNPGHFEATDPAAVTVTEAAIRAHAEPGIYAASALGARAHVTSHGQRLLKGRWLAQYIRVIITVHLTGEVVRVNVHPNAVIDTALAALDYGGSWTEAYDRRFARVLAA